MWPSLQRLHAIWYLRSSTYLFMVTFIYVLNTHANPQATISLSSCVHRVCAHRQHTHTHARVHPSPACYMSGKVSATEADVTCTRVHHSPACYMSGKVSATEADVTYTRVHPSPACYMCGKVSATEAIVTVKESCCWVDLLGIQHVVPCKTCQSTLTTPCSIFASSVFKFAAVSFWWCVSETMQKHYM